jgi:hypothetical protein
VNHGLKQSPECAMNKGALGLCIFEIKTSPPSKLATIRPNAYLTLIR